MIPYLGFSRVSSILAKALLHEPLAYLPARGSFHEWGATNIDPKMI